MAAMGVAISATPVIPGVYGASVTVRIRLRIIVIRSHVVPVWVIIIGCWIGVKTTRKSKTDSSSSNALSVSLLCCNESQSTYRQSNQEKLFHKISLFIFWFARAEASAGISSGVEVFPLSQHRMRAVVRFPGAFHSPTTAASAWSPLPAVQKKSWLEAVSEPAHLT
jgi:hypothetical protein